MKYLTLALLFAIPLCAANRYVRAGASGAANGTDWTNAYTALPSTLTRGDVYYIADGTYAAYSADDAVSGTSVITIKKATVSDHGTDTGWNNAYGDGQAVFGPITISTNYWVIDGTSRTSISSGHGILIETGAAVNPSSKGIHFTNASNLTFRYLEIAGHGPDGDGGGNDLLYTADNSSNITIQYCYIRDAGRVHILSRSNSNTWLLEYNYFLRCESHASEHSESWSFSDTKNVIFRYNVLEEIQGTGILAALDNSEEQALGSTPDNWEIYGNLFLNSTPSGGVLTTDAESYWPNVLFYNNTIHNVTNALIHVDNGSTTGWQIYNNIWHSCTGVDFMSDASTFDHNYNWFYPSGGTGGDYGEANGQVGSGDPFVNSAGGDFRLAAATNAGTSLSSPYNADLIGTARAVDGTWDRGAYEYDSGAMTPKSRSGGAQRFGGGSRN